MSKLIDFDRFRAEQAQEPVLFRIDGTEYKLPPTLPADIGVAVIRMQEDLGPDAKIPPDTVMDFCRSVFGPDLWTLILEKHRVTLEELPTLLYAVLAAYTEEDSDPKGQASPTSPTQRSSSTSSSRGRRSKRTSSASTAST